MHRPRPSGLELLDFLCGVSGGLGTLVACLLMSSENSLVLAGLAAFLCSLPFGTSLLAATAVLSVPMSLLLPVGSDLLPAIAGAIAGVAVLSRLRRKTLPNLPWSFIIPLCLFLILAALSINDTSFRYWNDPVGFDVSGRVLGALAVLAISGLLASLQTASPVAFLTSLSVMGGPLGLASSRSDLVNLIWAQRSVAIGLVAAMSLWSLRGGWGFIAVIWSSFFGVTSLLTTPEFKDGPIIALVVGCVVIVIQRFAGSGSKVVVATVSLIVAFMAILLGLTTVLDRDGNATSRVELLQAALHHDDLLTGAGFGSPPMSTGSYPHNAALEVFFGLGLIGLFVWVLLIAAMVRASAVTGLLPVFTTAAFFALFSGGFMSNPEYWMVGGTAIAAAGARRAFSGTAGVGPTRSSERIRKESDIGHFRLQRGV